MNRKKFFLAPKLKKILDIKLKIFYCGAVVRTAAYGVKGPWFESRQHQKCFASLLSSVMLSHRDLSVLSLDTRAFFNLCFFPVQLPSITTILLSLPLLPFESGGNVAQHTQMIYPILCSSQSAHEPRAGCIPTRVCTVKIKTFWLIRKLSWLSSG